MKWIFATTAVFAYVFALSPPALSQSGAPSIGIVYNTKDANSLSYDCNLLQDGRLKCEFTQASVRKVLDPELLDQKLREATVKGYESGVKELTQESAQKTCSASSAIASAFESGTSVSNEAAKAFGAEPEILNQHIATSAPLERRDTAVSMRALDAFCKSPTRANFENLLRANLDKDSRSCTVSGITFSQTFKRLSHGSADTDVWVVDATPEGMCGAVQLSRFEIAQDYQTKGSFKVWNYIAKKAITNPNAELMHNVPCSSLDEDEYVYDWKSRDIAIQCDYIKFSPL